MERKKAEHVLLGAGEMAELVVDAFEMTMESADGRALYDRAFTAYIRSEMGESPISELYDALQGRADAFAPDQ